MTPDEAARAAFRWLADQAVPEPGGAGWREDDTPFDDLYCGTAGVLLAAAEARSADLGGADLDEVAGAAAGRALHLARHDAPRFEADGDLGLFSGWAGLAAACRAWHTATGDAAAAEAAGRLACLVARRLVQGATPADRCTDIVSGDAGQVLALLPEMDADPVVADAVTVLVDRLLATAEDTPAGPQWRMVPGYPILMPNFSHGTAGVAFAFLAAAWATGREDLHAAAVRAGGTLLALAGPPPGWAVPMTIPRQAHRPPVSFGWCHGPTGTVRLFAALAATDPDPRWAAAVDRCLAALVASGIPERRYPGYWDNVARCCGSAGVGTLLLERHLATGDPDLLAFADRLAADVVARAVPQAVGVAWSNTEHTASPPDLRPQPGLMQGAAGIAGWLARLAAVHAGRSPAPLTGWV